MSWLPIAEIAAKVQAGELKAVDLVEQSLAAIEAKKEYNAIIATTAERARERAAAIDAAVRNGEKIGRLAGVPFIAKDNYLVFGAETTAASNMLKGFVAPYQSTVVNRLEAEGAICVAKANLDAFAHGASTENSDFGVVKNPHDTSESQAALQEAPRRLWLSRWHRSRSGLIPVVLFASQPVLPAV